MNQKVYNNKDKKMEFYLLLLVTTVNLADWKNCYEMLLIENLSTKMFSAIYRTDNITEATVSEALKA